MDKNLKAIADGYWEWLLAAKPTHAHVFGDDRYIDQVEDLSRQAEDGQIGELDGFAAAATALDPTTLTAADQITRQVLVHETATAAEQLRSRMAELNVDPSFGLHVGWQHVASMLKLTKPEHAEAMLVKWTKVNGQFHQAIQRLKQGVARDRTPPRSAVETVISQIDSYLASPVEVDPFVTLGPPPQLDEQQMASWREQLVDVVRKHVRPGYRAYRDALVSDVLDHARPSERPGVRWLPDGEEIYARAIRRHTTVERLPLQIHNTGLEIIDGLAGEYRELGSRVLGTSDLAVIFKKLRTDPQLRFSNGEEIVNGAIEGMARANAAAPDWFGRLPTIPCVMAEIPAHGAEEAPAAYYFPPADDGSRPGTYVVNTSAPHERARYEAEAVTFHEAVPGHHLEVALALELENAHPFQRHAYVTAFSEGWALYAERLADEMGLYSSDLARIGMLSGDSFRAGRLVVDTGLHALGWSRQEAVDYLIANSSHPLIEIEAEVDRYIATPGQALGYMIGRLEIQRLRAEAERTLGDRFEIKVFHDTVLGSGPVTLPVLDEIVTAWVASGG